MIRSLDDSSARLETSLSDLEELTLVAAGKVLQVIRGSIVDLERVSNKELLAYKRDFIDAELYKVSVGRLYGPRACPMETPWVVHSPAISENGSRRGGILT